MTCIGTQHSYTKAPNPSHLQRYQPYPTKKPMEQIFEMHFKPYQVTSTTTIHDVTQTVSTMCDSQTVMNRIEQRYDTILHHSDYQRQCLQLNKREINLRIQNIDETKRVKYTEKLKKILQNSLYIRTHFRKCSNTV